MSNCLVVVDYQNDFVNGFLGFPGAELLDEGIAEKINSYRKNGDTIIFTFDTHYDDYLSTTEGSYLPVSHCQFGTDGHKLYGKVSGAAADSDITFCKNTFGSDELFTYLKNHKFDKIELVGLVSNICVIANTVLAKTAQPETKIVVDASLTASFDKELHDAALKVMKGLHIEVIS